MKKLFISAIILTLLAFAFADGFLTTLKITSDQAQTAIWDSFSYGNYAGPTASTYHTFSVPVQVAMVKEIGAFAKAYSRTDDFKMKYTERKENQKPKAPEAYVPMSEVKKKQRDAMTANLKDIEAKANSFTGDMKKAMEDAAKIMKQQITAIDDPKNPMFTPQMEAMTKKAHDDQMKAYQDKLVEWQKQYPDSPNDLIKLRLTGFLQLSATVDFGAKLQKGPDSKMVFVNPDYEKKDADWKYIFRSGKDATNAARAVATQWLTEIK